MKTILIVEDSETVVDELKRKLEENNYSVLIANSGTSGLEQFKKHQSDISLIMTDLNMPGMGGMTMIEKINALGCEAPILVVSTESNPAVINQGRELGIKGWLVKPLTLDDKLLQAIGKLTETGS